jgi:hypothetical protein
VDPARLGWELVAFDKRSIKNWFCIIMSTVVLLLLLLVLLLMLFKHFLNLLSSYCKLDTLWQLHTLHMLKFNGLLACKFITMSITCTVETWFLIIHHQQNSNNKKLFINYIDKKEKYMSSEKFGSIGQHIIIVGFGVSNVIMTLQWKFRILYSTGRCVVHFAYIQIVAKFLHWHYCLTFWISTHVQKHS